MKPEKTTPATDSQARAARKSSKSGQKITRETTPNRGEIRQQTVHRQGHTK